MSPSPLHYVNVGPHGTFEASGRVRTTAEDVDRIFAHLRSQGAPRKVVLHFHGGLVGEAAGMDRAARMAPLYLAAGAHPVTFVWETGLLETIRANLTSISSTELFKKLLAWVLRKASGRLGLGPAGRGVATGLDDQAIARELERAAPFEDYQVAAGGRGSTVLGAAALDDAQLRRDLEAELEEDLDRDLELRGLLERELEAGGLLAPGQGTPVKPAGARGLGSLAGAIAAFARITIHVVRRFVDGRDHDFYPTVIEEILRELYLADFGAWAWGGMKAAAGDMWKPNAGLVGDARHVGRYLLERLARLQLETGVTIDLVGHSAGSIAICELLAAAADHPALRFRNVLLLAPAARSDLFHQRLLGNGDRFQALRVFTMGDHAEKQDHLVPILYPRSLLYFISGVLEPGAVDEPIVGMERFLSGRRPFDTEVLRAIRARLAQGGTTLVLSPTGDGAPIGLRSTSLKHGDFDDDEATRDSLRSVVAA